MSAPSRPPKFLAAILLALTACLGASVEVSRPAAARAVAVTFDDLPATMAGVADSDAAQLEDVTRRLLAAVRKHNIPAIGFVNEGKLFVDGARVADERRIALLKMWLDAGLDLGNHTYSHRDLNTTPLEEFQADVLRGEQVTRALVQSRGRRLQYFRHPFLHVGEKNEKRRAFEAFLARRGYIVAPVTMDTDDYVYAAAYARAVRRGDAAGAARIADDYPRYMEEVFDYFEHVSRRVTGREIPQILLLHANLINADRFAAVAEVLVRRGYRFVPIAEALEDPAYRLPDEFVGSPGNSWFNHWEVTAGRKPVPTPSAPEWVAQAE